MNRTSLGENHAIYKKIMIALILKFKKSRDKIYNRTKETVKIQNIRMYILQWFYFTETACFLQENPTWNMRYYLIRNRSDFNPERKQ